MSGFENLTEDASFGIDSYENYSALRKALDVGYDHPTLAQSIEGTLTALTYSAKHARMWQSIFKTNAKSTLEEYTTLDSYGSADGGFYDDGELPPEDNSQYTSHSKKIKYIGVTRGITHPSSLVSASVPPNLMAEENRNGTLNIIGKAETGLFYGNSDIIPQQWDGVFKQALDGGARVIDLQGSILTPEHVEDASYTSHDNYSMGARKIFGNGSIFSNFSKQFYDRQRWPGPEVSPAPKQVSVGTPMLGMHTQFGYVGFEADVFMKRKLQIPPNAATSANAPDAPVIDDQGSDVDLGAPTPGSPSLFSASHAGEYSYVVTAINQYGESDFVIVPYGGENDAVDIVEGGYVWFDINYSGTNKIYGYNIYRQKVGEPYDFRLIQTIPTDPEDPDITFIDINEDIDGTHDAILCDMSPDALALKRLLPLTKLPLARTSPKITWALLLYAVPILFKPKQFVIFKNIGNTAPTP